MTVQRRRGLPIVIYRVKVAEDNRGDKKRVHDPDNPHRVKAWIYPQRSAKAEVPGQQQINVVRVGVNAALEGVGLQSVVEFQDKTWDVVTPPAYHHGTRHNRHWSIDLRERTRGAMPGG